jgi:hypothetical protein
MEASGHEAFTPAIKFLNLYFELEILGRSRKLRRCVKVAKRRTHPPESDTVTRTISMSLEMSLENLGL